MHTSFFKGLPAFAFSLLIPSILWAYFPAEEMSEADIQIELNLTAQTSCALPDGSAAVVAIVENGQNMEIGDYEFNWYYDDGLTALPGNVTAPNYGGLTAGNYIVVATNLLSAEISEGIPFTIPDQIADNPQIQVDVTPVLSCSDAAPFGRIALQIDGGADPAAYQIDWFEADGETGLGGITSTAAISPDGLEASGLRAGTYHVVVVRIDQNGCISRLAIDVGRQDPGKSIEIDGIDILHLDHCTLPNGMVAVADVIEDGQIADADDYLYFWFKGQGTFYDPEEADYQGRTWAGLGAGQYTALVVHLATLCTSAPVSAEVENRIELPLVQLLRTHNTSCTDTPNGIIEADITGDANDYSFAWYSGFNTEEANLLGTQISQSELPGGSYTLLATHNTTLCSNSFQTTLNDVIENPLVSASVVSHRYNCDPDRIDGALAATVEGETDGYTFYWFSGEVDDPDTTQADTVTPAPTGLADGYYTVMARHDYSGCTSSPVVLLIEDRTGFPEITTQVRQNSACDLQRPNGELYATVGSQLDPDHDFEWYALGADDDLTLIANTQTAEQVAPGTYRIVVRAKSSGCASQTDVQVANIPGIPAPFIEVLNHQTSCVDEQPNGLLSAGIDGLMEAYRLFWFEGQISNPDTLQANTTGASMGGLAEGAYTLIAYHPETGCMSLPVYAEILDRVELPDIDVVWGQSEDELGKIYYDFSAAVNGLSEPEYQFFWYSGEAVDPLNQLGNWSTIGSLEAGKYTVAVTEIFTGCANTKTVSIFGPAPWPTENLLARALSHESVEITWSDKSEDEEGFHIERMSVFSSGFIRIATVEANSEIYVDNNLMPETEYTYRVLSFNGNGILPEIETASAVTGIRPPAAPKYLTADGLSPFDIELNWFDNSLNELGFIIERLNPDTQTFDSIAAATGTTFIDSGIVPGQLYTYRVAAYNDGGLSPYSNEASFFPVITGLESDTDLFWSFYPNPVTSLLFVRPPSTEPYELRILDAQGRIQAIIPHAEGESRIDLQNTAGGVMFIQIRNSAGTVTRRILIE